MEELFEQIAEQLAQKVFEKVSARIDVELGDRLKGATEICWLEEEAAKLLHCSDQTLADKRKAGLIDSTLNPAGRPAYMLHHLYGYLMRQETKNGRQDVTLADVLPFKRKEAAA